MVSTPTHLLALSLLGPAAEWGKSLVVSICCHHPQLQRAGRNVPSGKTPFLGKNLGNQTHSSVCRAETRKSTGLSMNMDHADQGSKCNQFIKSPNKNRIQQNGGKVGSKNTSRLMEMLMSLAGMHKQKLL